MAIFERRKIISLCKDTKDFATILQKTTKFFSIYARKRTKSFANQAKNFVFC